jgi:hypothetical protein
MSARSVNLKTPGRLLRSLAYLCWLPIWPAAARAQDTLWATYHDAARMSRQRPEGNELRRRLN